MSLRCKICILFDCGSKCKCICHNLGSTDKIRHDLTPDNIFQLQQITKEDIELVAHQTNVSFETAKKALEKSKGDLVKTIFDLT